VKSVGGRLGPVCLYLGALGLCAQAILPLSGCSTCLLPREVLATPPTIPAAHARELARC
jgi:hypothetical protein